MKNETVATQIREKRIAAALSQTELAEKLGVSQVLISNWEKAKRSPSPEHQAKLARILGAADGNNVGGDFLDASPVAAWVKKERISRGFSIPELADKSGLTPPAIYRIESGQTRNLREATRKKLEQVLSKMPAETISEAAQETEIIGLGSMEDFDPHSDDERPTKAGIYVLYDISERPIYVGEGKDVRKRIRDHEEKFWFKRPIVQSASWIAIGDEDLRRKVETILIKFLKSNAVINKQNVDRS
jgi:transcriptional regulator with XRE-family HTH domain